MLCSRSLPEIILKHILILVTILTLILATVLNFYNHLNVKNFRNINPIFISLFCILIGFWVFRFMEDVKKWRRKRRVRIVQAHRRLGISCGHGVARPRAMESGAGRQVVPVFVPQGMKSKERIPEFITPVHREVVSMTQVTPLEMEMEQEQNPGAEGNEESRCLIW